tara:strand:- start:1761 stop:2228 length:468 start_codon:yes stop_codon:yes gene_type:complete
MARESNSGLNVLNIYGPRPVPDMARGTIKTEGGYNELTFEFSGKDINENLTNVLTTLPAGVRFVDFYVEVQEAFVVTGTTPGLEIGTSGTEETNGFTISEAILEAVGISAISTTFAGTWAATLAADTAVGLALSGTTPVVTSAGHARIVARYLKV